MMKKVFFLVSIIILAFAACTTNATTQIENVSEQDELAAVEAAVQDFKTGFVNADNGLLDSITADKLVYGHSSGKVQNKQEFIDEIISLQPFDYLSVDITEQTITISGDCAVVRHLFAAEYTANDVPGNLKIGISMVWQKQEGKWKLLARQAYPLRN